MASLRLTRRIGREIGRYRNAVPKLRGLDWVDWRNLIRAQWALLRAQATIRRQPTGEMVGQETSATGAGPTNRVEDARRVALAVNRAAAFGLFRPRCLARSIALRRLLAAEGIHEAQVRVGVRLEEGRFIAHAWVEYGGEVVGDDPASVSLYAPLGVTVAETG